MVESLIVMLTKKRGHLQESIYKPIDLQFVINIVGKRISLVSKWNIVNQLGKHDFSCG